jgi:hypothetical protein
MTEYKGETEQGTPIKTEKQELREKGRQERGNDERLGKEDDGSSNHPVTKQSGIQSESNSGQDLTSGDG